MEIWRNFDCSIHPTSIQHPSNTSHLTFKVSNVVPLPCRGRAAVNAPAFAMGKNPGCFMGVGCLQWSKAPQGPPIQVAPALGSLRNWPRLGVEASTWFPKFWPTAFSWKLADFYFDLMTIRTEHDVNLESCTLLDGGFKHFYTYCFIFICISGNDPNWLIFLQMGWNHQLVLICCCFLWKIDFSFLPSGGLEALNQAEASWGYEAWSDVKRAVARNWSRGY